MFYFRFQISDFRFQISDSLAAETAKRKSYPNLHLESELANGSTYHCIAPTLGARLGDVTVAGDLTHFDPSGASRMVDVGSKAVTQRVARASGLVRMQPATLQRIKDRGLA